MEQEKYYERLYFVVEAWRSGKTLEEIGTVMDLTRERVRQLLVKARDIGILRDDEVGGQAQRARNKVKARNEQRREHNEARAQKYFGCSYEELLRLNNGHRAWTQKYKAFSEKTKTPETHSPAYRYFQQKRSAANYGYPWNLTFPQWWAIWQKNPELWELRGRGRGRYVLGRLDSDKPFEEGNVQVMDASDVSAMGGARGWARERERGVSRFGNPYTSIGAGVRARQDLALRLHDDEGKSMSEVASIMGIGQNTASGYACAARKRRREIIAKGLGSETPKSVGHPLDPPPSFAGLLVGRLFGGKKRSST